MQELRFISFQQNLFLSCLSYLISSHLISSHLISSHLILSYLISSHLISSHLISSHLISSHFISSHLISSHLISPHLILSYLIFCNYSFIFLFFSRFVKHNRVCVTMVITVIYTVAHNCHGKKENFTANRKTSRRKGKPHGKKENLTANRKTSRQVEKERESRGWVNVFEVHHGIR